jgi:crotonobetainyl-CoA:carnitine CoA-transferase CaiB-like acyl-CoA transferase
MYTGPVTATMRHQKLLSNKDFRDLRVRAAPLKALSEVLASPGAAAAQACREAVSPFATG